MKSSLKHLILHSIVIFIMTGCFFPTRYTYFAPSSIQGKAYDSIPCGHITREEDAIKIKADKTTIDVQTYHTKNNKLKILISITKRNNINFNLEKLIIKDTNSNNTYLPTNYKLKSSYSVRAIMSSWDTEKVLVHWISLTYDININALSNFELIFPKDTLYIDNKETKLFPIKFNKKEVNTIRYITINC